MVVRQSAARRLFGAVAAAAFTLLALAGPAAAEGRIRIAEQFGLGYLPQHVMRQLKLIEKHGKEQGVDIQVDWVRLSGGAAMNDALLSDSIDLGSAGVGPMLTIWDRTKGSFNVKAIASLNSMPLFLTSTNPDVKTVKDLTDKDKIALPAPKVGVQARVLQMAAAQAFGDDKFDALDKLTVALPHPDGTVAMLSGSGGITGHLSAPPFQYQQLENPKIHKVFSSYDLLGPSSFNLIWCKEAFRTNNPKTYKAFLDALKEAMEVINKDHDQAAEIYLAQNKGDGLDKAFILKLLDDPDIRFTVVPQGVQKYADFMHKVGAIKNHPASWKDSFFEDLHGEQGS